VYRSTSNTSAFAGQLISSVALWEHLSTSEVRDYLNQEVRFLNSVIWALHPRISICLDEQNLWIICPF